jgi:hypothetical protein
MVFLMRGHLDLKKSHFDPRNRVPDVVLALSFVALTSLTHLDEVLYIARQGLPMEMLINGLDGLSFARMS